MSDMYLNQFLEYLEVQKNYSKHTISSYRKDLRDFCFYTEAKQKNIKTIEYAFIREYIVHLHSKNHKATTINRHISALRSLYKYLVKQREIDYNPMELVSTLKKEKKLPTVLSEVELSTLLEMELEQTPLSYRNGLLLELLYATGIRVSELVGIRLFDIHMGEQTIKVLGKGNKERIVLFGRSCLEKLNHYLTFSRPELLKEKETNYLFLNKNGTPLTDRGVRLIIDQMIKKAAISRNVSPHTLRHTFATHMLGAGASLKIVQELLGHADLSSTQIYTHVTTDQLKEVHRKAHPRGVMTDRKKDS